MHSKLAKTLIIQPHNMLINNDFKQKKNLWYFPHTKNKTTK